MKNNIWFHADDFGVTVEQSERILGVRSEELAVFYMSSNRSDEAECLKLLGKI